MAVKQTPPKPPMGDLRRLAQEFVDLTEHGDFSDFAVVNRYSQLSAMLSLAVGPLINVIDELQAEREDGGRPRIVKFDSMGGRA